MAVKESETSQIAFEVEQIKTDNTGLYEQVIKTWKSSQNVSEYIQSIAKNLERLCIIYDQKEYIQEICSRIIVHLRNLGYGKMEQTVYQALSGKEFQKYKHQNFSSRSLDINSDLPEDISIEMKDLVEAVKKLKQAHWQKYPDRFIQQVGYGTYEAREKIQQYQEQNNIIDLSKSYDPLDSNAKNSDYYEKRPLEEPPKDESMNCIRAQYEFLIRDIQYFLDEFQKRYYPPDKEKPYYARSVWLLRKLFVQYPSDKIHRDYYSWSEIYAADKGIHPSGKSAKEISARYGRIVRRHDKQTGEPIYGRKGICKEQIQKKRTSLTDYLQEFYYTMPLFMFLHRRYGEDKERRLVDHTIDIKNKRQHYA
jgi:hypothetical protein